jgi:hypothetical protein
MGAFYTSPHHRVGEKSRHFAAGEGAYFSIPQTSNQRDGGYTQSIPRCSILRPIPHLTKYPLNFFITVR